MKRCALLLLVALGINTTSWGYHITEVSVCPANPGPCDDVSVTVSGWKPASNYALDHASFRIVGTFVMLDLYWHSEGCGAQVVTSYAETKGLGKLGPGTYTVCVKSWLNGLFCETMSNSFRVVASGGNHGYGCGCPLCRWWFYPCWPRCYGGGSSTSNSSSFTSTIGSGAATAFTFGSSRTPGSSSSSSSFSQSISR